MIQKVAKLKKFGIFRDFSWDSETPECARFNLIYGWNKSGKTTFSRTFSSCEYKTTSFKQYPKGGEYEIKTKDGLTIKNTDCENCAMPIKVFNKDFIEENVSFDPHNPSNPIVYISEKDIKTTENLKELKEKVILLSSAYETAKVNKQTSEKAESEFRTSLAREVKDLNGDFKIQDKYRDYDKASLKKIIDRLGIHNFKRLSDEEFEEKKKFINKEAAKEQTYFQKMEIILNVDGISLHSLDDIQEQLKRILERKVVAETIDRLKDDPELNKWIQHGLELHTSNGEKEKCLFCQNILESNYLEKLSKHFSDDYEKLQKTIELFRRKIEELNREPYSEENEELHSDLQDGYREEIKKLNRLIEKINQWSENARNALNQKHDNPHNVVKPPGSPDNYETEFNDAIDEINMVLEQHNNKVENHSDEIKKIKEKIESHLIAVAIQDQDYAKILEEMDKCSKAEQSAKREMDSNNQEISKLEKETSNIGKALQKINKHLEGFFGREEIQLELDDGKKGYIIKRDGEIAQNLSEGEKNAIAFSYFIAKTQERNFKVSEGLLFVDDPISSFDSNFIFHCFAVIKNHFNHPGQLFISTHNFEFFNLVKDWFAQKNRKTESHNKRTSASADKKPLPCEFFMIENIVKDSKRCALIKPLEETLKRYKSEYHFLFARLNQFVNDASPDYADFYTIGNIARRFLEIYANFKIPTTGDLASKVEQLSTSTVDETDRQKVYRLVQEFSHSLDPISAIEHKDKTECQEAIKILMKIVKESDGAHYEALKSNIH